MTNSQDESEAIKNLHHETEAIKDVLLRTAGRHPERQRLHSAAIEIKVASLWKSALATRPRTIETQLESIRKTLRRLRNDINNIDSEIRTSINQAGDPYWQEIREAEAGGDQAVLAEIALKYEPVPQEQWTVDATLGAMERLDDALVTVIQRVITNSQSLPESGRRPDFAKRMIACAVHRYFTDLGLTPRLWPEDAPSEPWQRDKSEEPFAIALTEIVEILNLPPGIEAAGEYATSKLAKNPG